MAETQPSKKNKHAAAMARQRWAKVPAARRTELGRAMVNARWAKRKEVPTDDVR